MSDLEEVITEAVEDASQPEPVEIESDVPELATADPSSDTPVEAETPEPAPVEAKSDEPSTPEQDVDDFEKQYGISAQSVTGRENRIPYSRVKKIVQKAVNDRAKALESEYNPKLQDYETKVKTYEDKLGRVAAFEQMLLNDPEQFLERLSNIPSYQPFFQAIEALMQKVEAARTGTPVVESGPVDDGMPAPNQELSDGSKVYDIDGLRKLLDWQAKQTEERVIKQVEDYYGPIRREWQTEQQVRAVLPKIRAEIADARTWPMFTENEDEIVKILQTNPKSTLESAYRQVVFPKIVPARDQMRQELLKEIKTAPRATATSASPVKPTPAAPATPKGLEDVIKAALEQSGLK